MTWPASAPPLEFHGLVHYSAAGYVPSEPPLAPPGRLAPAAIRGFDAVDSSASNGVEMFSPLEIQLKAKLAAAEAEVLRLTTRVQELEKESKRDV